MNSPANITAFTGHCLRLLAEVPFIVFLSMGFLMSCQGQDRPPEAEKRLKIGAEHTDVYLPWLKDKEVALVVNQTSVIGHTHLVDTLLSMGVSIRKIFAPEHGFRGQADAGEQITDGRDPKTGLPIVSLYGQNKKPTEAQLADVDVLLFDIQDVGARFYTYISTMHYVMEACAENQKPLIVLDRPNPHGHYTDGPVLKEKFRSFVGMHPIPVVHGLTVGELAQMINGEQWLKNGVQCQLNIVLCENYTHQTPYELPIAPSPNLPNATAVGLYPSLCFFEGTVVSVGRGTPAPFQMVGSPYHRDSFDFSFTPGPSLGAKNPMYNGEACFGIDLQKDTPPDGMLDLAFLTAFFRSYKGEKPFFKADFFDKLAGTDQIRQMVLDGRSSEEIKASWQEELAAYQQLRERYLLYPL